MSREFSSRRSFTYIACAAIIGVCAPFAAQAATGFIVITDPVHPTAQARVSSTGRLLSDVTGSTVKVTGSTAPLGTPWSAHCSNPTGNACYILLPAGRTVELRTVSTQFGSTDGVPGYVSVEAPLTVSPSGTTILYLPASPMGTSSGTTYYAGSTPVDWTLTVPATGTNQLLVRTMSVNTTGFTSVVLGYVR